MRDTVEPRPRFFRRFRRWSLLRHATVALFLLIAVIGYQRGHAAVQEGAQGRPRRVTPEPRQSQPKPDPAKEQKPAATTPPKRDDVEETEAIRISSNLVTVPVSVTDSSGQPVRSLTAQDFQLDEEGARQTISLVGQPGQTPVELALLFDVSGSVNERFRFEQQAAARFLRAVIKPNDLVSVFSIALSPALIVARTRDVEAAVAGAMTLGPTKEPTAFYDAVGLAAQYLGKSAAQGSRRVLVVISDGEDNQSERFHLEAALRELQRNDCLYYSINPSGPSIRLNKISQKGQDSMIALAAETGGVAFLPQQLEDLDNIFRQIAGELQAQYLLGYYSTNETTDGKFRRITARVAGRAELRVRSRQGYYAPRE